MMVFLEVDPEVLLQRVSARVGHFFPRKLLESQLATLEHPSPAEEPRVRVIAGDGDSQATVTEIIATLWPAGPPAD
jgi:gluconokinase